MGWSEQINMVKRQAYCKPRSLDCSIEEVVGDTYIYLSRELAWCSSPLTDQFYSLSQDLSQILNTMLRAVSNCQSVCISWGKHLKDSCYAVWGLNSCFNHFFRLCIRPLVKNKYLVILYRAEWFLYYCSFGIKEGQSCSCWVTF